MNTVKPLRVLHVVGRMNRGGVETWLMHVLRTIESGRLKMDFMVHTTAPGAYDDEIRALGGSVIPCLEPSRPWVYARNFRRVLREHGPYDVVHSHVHHFSGLVLRLANQQGVPVRIAHSHSDTSSIQAQANLARRAYFSLMRTFIDRCCTHGLAASQEAASALFKPGWQEHPRYQVLYYGIDLDPFAVPVDRASARAELGIPSDAFVVGHVGRFMAVKNHAFLVEVAKELAVREPMFQMVLVGDGELRPAIERRIADAGLTDRVVFAGTRSDIPRLMTGVIDVLVLPSLYEGLPVVGIEAQAAGLPVVMSDAVTPEVDILPGLVQRLSLRLPASAWAETIIAVRNDAAIDEASANAAQILRGGQFDIRRTISDLERCYVEE